MKNETFSQLTNWATNQISHYAMLGYILKEVNEPSSGNLLIILAEYHEKQPIAEVSVSTEGNYYLGQFNLLPNKEGPVPQQLSLKTTDIQVLIDWLSTGHTPETAHYDV